LAAFIQYSVSTPSFSRPGEAEEGECRHDDAADLADKQDVGELHRRIRSSQQLYSLPCPTLPTQRLAAATAEAHHRLTKKNDGDVRVWL